MLLEDSCGHCVDVSTKMSLRKTDIQTLRKLHQYLLDMDIDRVLFTDEKVFSVARSFKCEDERRQLVTPVFVGVSPSCRVIKLLPRCPPLTGNEMIQILSSVRKSVTEEDLSFILQHDRAPWYSARVTQHFVRRNFSSVLPVYLWPVPSRLYNPLDYWLFPFVQREIHKNHKLQNSSDLFNFVSETIQDIPDKIVKLNNAKLLDKLSAKINTELNDKTIVDWVYRNSRVC